MSQKIILLIAILGLVLSCNTPKSDEKIKTHKLKYAELLAINETDSITTVIITNPETNLQEGKFALFHKGYQGGFPVGFERIQIPVKRMAALSTTYIGMLNAIDGLGCVKVTTERKYVSNKKIGKKIDSGKVLTSGYEHALTPEAYLKAKIQLIVFSGFGQPFTNEQKLKQLGISCMANYDWKESHPLGKAEWIKLFGILTDKSEEATAYFNSIETKYFNLKQTIRNSNSSKVLVGGLNGTNWIAPAGKSFMAGMLADAGIDYCFKETPGAASLNLSLEQVYRDQQGCKIWINAEATTKADLLKLNSRIAYFDVFKSGRIYSYLHNPNYFWELSTVNPHWLLEDYVRINAGETNAKRLHFYKMLK